METPLREALDRHAELQHLLFRRGYLLSAHPVSLPLAGWPFYSNWTNREWGGVNLYIHKETTLFTGQSAGNSVALVGHAYDPTTREADEGRIVQRLSQLAGTPRFQPAVDGLTGVFVLLWRTQDGPLCWQTDAAGILPAFYGQVGDDFLISSHAQLIADLCQLEPAGLGRDLMAYKWYRRVTGAYLPADITPFEDVRRTVPDMSYQLSADGRVGHRRFWPLQPIVQAETEEAYREVIAQAAQLLRANMELIARKWERPAISLTGGTDSTTTFAAARGCYDRYTAFSYFSAPKEAPDVEAAQVQAKAFGVPHTRYDIPTDRNFTSDFELKAAILSHNSAYSHPLRENELRKRIYLEEHCPISVEVKSWVSETIRGAVYHRYRRTSLPRLSPRLFRNIYKIFLQNRRLAHRVDRLYRQYIDEFEYRKIPAAYPPADMHFHEVTWGSWGGVSIEEMKYCFDITVPYNNRRLLDLLFHVPLPGRLSDQHHRDMKRLLNSQLADMGIHVANVEETKRRAQMLGLIFTLNQHLPF